MTRAYCNRPAILTGGLASATVLAAAIALTSLYPEPAAADSKQTSAGAATTKQKTGRKRAVAVSCSPEDYCDLDFDIGRCVPNEKGKTKKVECKLMKDE